MNLRNSDPIFCTRTVLFILIRNLWHHYYFLNSIVMVDAGIIYRRGDKRTDCLGTVPSGDSWNTHLVRNDRGLVMQGGGKVSVGERHFFW